MAAIAPRAIFLLALAACAALADEPPADQAHAVLQVINQVASGLTAGDPSDAMIPFDKSLPDYVALQNEFIGLTDGYLITNEADVLDEQDSSTETQLTLRWILTLTTKQSNENSRKTAEVHVRLRLRKSKWKIVEFSPVDLFTP